MPSVPEAAVEHPREWARAVLARAEHGVARRSGRFSGFAIVLAEQSNKLREAIRHHDADDLLARPVADLVSEFVARFDLEPPAILWDEAEQSEPTEAMVEIPADRFDGHRDRGTRRVTGTHISVGIPLNGTIELLGGNGSTSLMRTWPNTAVQDDHLIIWNEWAKATPQAVASWYERERSDIERQVESIQRDVAQWRSSVVDLATRSVEARRQRLLDNLGLEGALGLRVRRRNEHPRPVPVRRTKVATTRARRAADWAFVPEPELDNRTYAEVLDIICLFGRGLERSPATAAKFNEEELRDQILMHLNGHFEGEAGGELFNGAGKTDILIRHQDRNVFIGECKFWEGPKKLSDAIDQLAVRLGVARHQGSACRIHQAAGPNGLHLAGRGRTSQASLLQARWPSVAGPRGVHDVRVQTSRR